MTTKTIREILASNQAERKRPYNIAQLARMSKVSRSTIYKIETGDYDGAEVKTIRKVFRVLGYEIGLTATQLN